MLKGVFWGSQRGRKGVAKNHKKTDKSTVYRFHNGVAKNMCLKFTFIYLI